MTSKEQAEKIVEAAKLEKGSPVRAKRLEQLDAELRRHVNLFWGWTEKGQESQRDTETKEGVRAFFNRNANEKTKMLEAVFGDLAALVAQALELSWTYERYGNKPFRAPGTVSQQLCQRAWLRSLAHLTNTWDQPLEWYVTHCTRMNWGSADEFAPVFAAAINAGNERIFEMLKAIVNNELEYGVMDDHVLVGLLMTDRPDAWEVIEKLLLAAQRQEGLRQSIFNATSQAHPTAFKRMLRLMLEHDLLRFSSSIQFLHDILPILPSEPTPKQVKTALEELFKVFEDDADREAIITNERGASPMEVYLGLWCEACTDARRVLKLLETVWLEHENSDYRVVSLRLLQLLGLEHDLGGVMVKAQRDEDLRVVAVAMSAGNDWHPPQFEGAFDLLEGILKRVPNKLEFPDPITPEGKLVIDPNSITMRMVRSLGKLSVKRLIPHWEHMGEYARRETIQAMGKTWNNDAETRKVLLAAIADPATYVRSNAFEVIEKKKLELADDELLQLEDLLSRKRADMRKGIIRLILAQSEDKVRASSERLNAAKKPEQRAAGAELEAVVKQKAAPETVASLNDGLGLFDPQARTQPITLEPMGTPKKGVVGAIKKLVGQKDNVGLMSNAAHECIKSLGKLVAKHADTALRLKRSWNDEMYDTTLGEAWLEGPDLGQPFAAQGDKLILREIWEDWYANRGASERDPDGFELLRALYAMQQKDWSSRKRPEALEKVFQSFHAPHTPINADKLKHWRITYAILEWLTRLHPVAGAQEFVLRAAEHSLAVILPVVSEAAKNVPEKELKKTNRWDRNETAQYVLDGWASDSQLLYWFTQAGNASLMTWTPTQQARFWQLLHAMDLNATWLEARAQGELEPLLIAWREGIANETDVLDQLIGPRSFSPESTERSFPGLAHLTRRKGDKLFEGHPNLKPIVQRIVNRILEIECTRGELPTPASQPAMFIGNLEGSSTLVRLLVALGKTPFVRGYISTHSRDHSRAAVFSHLIRNCFPATTDEPEAFAKLVKDHKITEQRLLELGLYAPQWAHLVAHAVGWDGAREGIWWLHAHTKSSDWYLDQAVRDAWKAEIAEQTPLTSEDLLEGAVDVKWFNTVHAQLGEARWKKLYEAAKYASSGTGHTRAKLFADAMTGNVPEKDVLERIKSKRHQDSVRALGLLPLGKNTENTVLERYKAIQEFLRTSKKAGGQQKQASESLAARIGMLNLARTAGYADPTRLTWAMETEAVADLRDGPIELGWDGVKLMLSINPLGEPELEVSKGGKVLKDIPSSLKKNEAVLALRERKKELERQVSRMRSSLEMAMVRGDHFSGAELVKLFDHPMLRAMLKNLVWMLEGDALPAFGFPEGFDPKRKLEKNDPYKNAVGALYDYNGVDFAFNADAKLRIAHPHDLYTHEVWASFQANLFDDTKLESLLRVQPFKQIFRELYPLTPQEQGAAESLRYAGYQVNPKQSIALLGARGWVSRYEEGISKTFFDENVTAWVESNLGWTTPAEVEAPKLERVYFTRRGDWKRLKLEEVPPRVFSEVMRDVDLVVSVAHVGGVDPEASLSTVDMRAAMVRETARLLKLENVRVDKNLVLVDGKLNKYSVHLGSGTVHQLPGGYVCIVAVQSQQRGRVFLPFADNDPRTAEVVAKVMLLAKDHEIQDPIIMRQIA